MTWHVEDYILLCFVHRRQQNCRNTSSSTNLAQELLAWGRHNAASIVSPCTFACPRAIPIACTGITASIYNAHQSLSSASQCYARCCKQPTVSPTCTDFRANQNDRTAFAWFFQKGTFEHLHKTRSKTSLVIAQQVDGAVFYNEYVQATANTHVNVSWREKKEKQTTYKGVVAFPQAAAPVNRWCNHVLRTGLPVRHPLRRGSAGTGNVQTFQPNWRLSSTCVAIFPGSRTRR